jgi:hypothetical protein
MVRYHGEFSRCIDEALSAADWRQLNCSRMPLGESAERQGKPALKVHR